MITLVNAVPSIGNVFGVLFMIFFIYAVRITLYFAGVASDSVFPGGQNDVIPLQVGGVQLFGHTRFGASFNQAAPGSG